MGIISGLGIISGSGSFRGLYSGGLLLFFDHKYQFVNNNMNVGSVAFFNSLKEAFKEKVEIPIVLIFVRYALVLGKTPYTSGEDLLPRCNVRCGTRLH